jgi:hypothetical protein
MRLYEMRPSMRPPMLVPSVLLPPCLGLRVLGPYSHCTRDFTLTPIAGACRQRPASGRADGANEAG